MQGSASESQSPLDYLFASTKWAFNVKEDSKGKDTDRKVNYASTENKGSVASLKSPTAAESILD